MSIIFGTRKTPEAIITRQEMLYLARATERYAPDGTSIATHGHIGMGFQPYHTHERSNLESQPVKDALGNMLSLDGRIDNHAELCDLLGIREKDAPDSLIILNAFLRWGGACFSRFIGDWAIVIWSVSNHQIYLARDHAGTRTLYFTNLNGTLLWSTYLESFFANGQQYALDEQYVAYYLGSLPVRDLTPYKGIRSVPPAHCLEVRDDRITINSHWEWIGKGKTRYQSDRDYEEHFLSVFERSVERRSGPGAPILAHLSGGMDSTSIVCMSDHARRSRYPNPNLLDTISFYDNSEPNWNEHPYFSTVETTRGKTGIHVERSFMDFTYEPPDPLHGVCLFPGGDSSTIELDRKLEVHFSERGYRAILSGLGGDEVLGGVPTPTPELADYLVSGNAAALLRKTISWCLANRNPLLYMLYDTIKFTADLYSHSHRSNLTIPPWITPNLRKYCMNVSEPPGMCVWRPRMSPSAICNGFAWWSIMETLPHIHPSCLVRHEYRYPYLDRDLVEFLFSIPRDQLVRPGRRRSLMRRALREIVPMGVLERRRKAYLSRGPLISLRASKEKIDALFTDSFAAAHGLIDRAQLRSAWDLTISRGDPQWSGFIMKTIGLELWIRGSYAKSEARPSIM